jgi:hypothetical protein
MRPLVVLLCFLFAACNNRGTANPNSGSAATDSVQARGTKLERFVSKTGSVVIRSFSPVGTTKGLYESSSTVEAKEFTNAADGSKIYGITIRVVSGQTERESVSSIDYDEIDSLLKGIDYIRKLDKGVTQLADFEADYRTRGDFRVTTFSSNEGILGAVESGQIGGVSAYYTLEQLGELRSLIARSVQLLDSIRGQQPS